MEEHSDASNGKASTEAKLARLRTAIDRVDAEADARWASFRRQGVAESLLSSEERELYLRAGHPDSFLPRPTDPPLPEDRPESSGLSFRKDFGEVLDHLMETNPWVGSLETDKNSRDGTQHGQWVIRDEYFTQYQTDHLLTIPSWSRLTAVTTVQGVDLTVPFDMLAAVGTKDGYWVMMEVVTSPGETPRVSSVEIGRCDLGDLSDAPKFPLRRWMAEAILKSNEQLLSGATSPGYRHKSRVISRSNSPDLDALAHVAKLRDVHKMSFSRIGEAIGRHESTAHRWYKRAKGQGL